MLTLGIDLASADRRTAVCAVRWDHGTAAVVSLAVTASDADLLTHMRGADSVGIDVPFGWPVDFVTAIRAYSETGAWPPSVPAPSEAPKRLQYRATDRYVHHVTGRWPLSVSSDRIAIPAMRVAALLSRLAADGRPVPRDGSGRGRRGLSGGGAPDLGLPGERLQAQGQHGRAMPPRADVPGVYRGVALDRA